MVLMSMYGSIKVYVLIIIASLVPTVYQIMFLDRQMMTQISLLLEGQSDQGLYCLLFHLHLLETLFHGKTS